MNHFVQVILLYYDEHLFIRIEDSYKGGAPDRLLSNSGAGNAKL